MKISFTRILNSDLPEPYQNLKTNILYITDRGYIYPEGSDTPIDMCEPEVIPHLTKNKSTSINEDILLKLPMNVESDNFYQAIKLNRDILSYVHQVKYASVKNTGAQFNWSREHTKDKLERLERMNILNRYGSYFVVNDEIKDMLEMELKK